MLGLIAATMLAAVAASAPTCATAPPATVAFKYSCTTIDPTDKACWEPHLPTRADTVVFPSGTRATWAHSSKYTALIVRSAVVAASATVTLEGGAIQVIDCFTVEGTLKLVGGKGEGTPMNNFEPDTIIPEGTDCQRVSKGFTPRICGPGVLYVSPNAVVSVDSLYASIFSGLTVPRGSVVTLSDGAFLWGNTTVSGKLHAKGRLFLHGYLFNDGVVTADAFRSDYWTTFYSRPAPIVVHNLQGGTLNISSYIITDIPTYYGKLYPTYRLTLLNEGEVNFAGPGVSETGVDIVNRGTISWVPPELFSDFYQVGTAVNMGKFVSYSIIVHLSSYVSDGGSLITHGGGEFHLDNSAGPDEAIVELCRKQRPRTPRTAPLRVPLADTPIVKSNQSCAKSPCPPDLCCGKDLVCETARCHCNYGSGPVCCCTDNAFCGGSSHGPYCGSGFGWEVDADCMESLTSIDRYEYDVALKHFGVAPPRFGRHRFELRGLTRIAGEGHVVMGQEVAVSGVLYIDHGATVRLQLEGGAVALPGTGYALIDGTLSVAIRTRFDNSTMAMHIRHGGELRVPRAATLLFNSGANVTLAPQSTLRVDGQLLFDGARGLARHCGSTVGQGSIIGSFDVATACSTTA